MRLTPGSFLSRFATDQSGATSLEYGLIIALIFLVILSSMTAFGKVGTDIFNSALNAVSGVM